MSFAYLVLLLVGVLLIPYGVDKSRENSNLATCLIIAGMILTCVGGMLAVLTWQTGE